jgi:hypothetical protein
MQMFLMLYVQLPLGFKRVMFKTFLEKGGRYVTGIELELPDKILCYFYDMDFGEHRFSIRPIVKGQAILLDCLSLEHATHTVSRNFGKKTA